MTITLPTFTPLAEFPPRWRRFHRVIAHSTTLSRMASFVLHYRF
jgi:hypothetical protein